MLTETLHGQYGPLDHAMDRQNEGDRRASSQRHIEAPPTDSPDSNGPNGWRQSQAGADPMCLMGIGSREIDS